MEAARSPARSSIRCGAAAPSPTLPVGPRFWTRSPSTALNLYSSQIDAFEQEDRRAFATRAAIALAGAHTEANLHATLENRDVIGMAKGILTQRHDIGAIEAFRLLVETSQTTNMKLHQIAAWLVEHRPAL
ncbi:ANTAR domain-containing protein [Amycolatopsis sp. NPDC005232]|uniref:ANTAR domain-containing protein n=1 Tax=Amycolatopsis sp. NPDC005232 TaxID=3157027 RepID=UPI0033A007A4